MTTDSRPFEIWQRVASAGQHADYLLWLSVRWEEFNHLNKIDPTHPPKMSKNSLYRAFCDWLSTKYRRQLQ